MPYNQSAAFVLRRKPYRENALLLDLYTQHEGRISAIARFSKKQSMRLKGMLEPFRLLEASWTGRGEVFTMTQTEERGRFSLRQDALLQAMYMNELLLRVFQPLQATPELFEQYQQTLFHLQRSADMRQVMLFELAILAHCGHHLNLWYDDKDEQAIVAGERYCFQFEQGLTLVNLRSDLPDANDTVLSGELLIALREPAQLSLPLGRELRQVLDRLWRILLKGKTLYARQLLSE